MLFAPLPQVPTSSVIAPAQIALRGPQGFARGAGSGLAALGGVLADNARRAREDAEETAALTQAAEIRSFSTELLYGEGGLAHARGQAAAAVAETGRARLEDELRARAARIASPTLREAFDRIAVSETALFNNAAVQHVGKQSVVAAGDALTSAAETASRSAVKRIAQAGVPLLQSGEVDMSAFDMDVSLIEAALESHARRYPELLDTSPAEWFNRERVLARSRLHDQVLGALLDAGDDAGAQAWLEHNADELDGETLIRARNVVEDAAHTGAIQRTVDAVVTSTYSPNLAADPSSNRTIAMMESEALEQVREIADADDRAKVREGITRRFSEIRRLVREDQYETELALASDIVRGEDVLELAKTPRWHKLTVEQQDGLIARSQRQAAGGVASTDWDWFDDAHALALSDPDKFDQLDIHHALNIGVLADAEHKRLHAMQLARRESAAGGNADTYKALLSDEEIIRAEVDRFSKDIVPEDDARARRMATSNLLRAVSDEMQARARANEKPLEPQQIRELVWSMSAQVVTEFGGLLSNTRAPAFSIFSETLHVDHLDAGDDRDDTISISRDEWLAASRRYVTATRSAPTDFELREFIAREIRRGDFVPSSSRFEPEPLR